MANPFVLAALRKGASNLYNLLVPSLNSQEDLGMEQYSGFPSLNPQPIIEPLSAQSQGQILANQPTINTKVSSPLMPQGQAPQKKGSEQILGTETRTTEPRSGSSLSKIGNILSMIGATAQDVDPGSRGGGAVQRQLALQEQMMQGEAQREQAQWEKEMKAKMFAREGEKSEWERGYKERELQIKIAELGKKMASNVNLTEGQKAVDRKFADTYADFTLAGGYTDVMKQLDQLKTAYSALGKGGLTGPAQGMMPIGMRAIVNPKSVETQQMVEDVIQRNLRATLGPQFTEKEGKLFMERAFNPALPEKTNQKSLDRAYKQIASAAKAKQDAIDYFEKNGTITGYKGASYTIVNGEMKPTKGQIASLGATMPIPQQLQGLNMINSAQAAPMVDYNKMSDQQLEQLYRQRKGIR